MIVEVEEPLAVIELLDAEIVEVVVAAAPGVTEITEDSAAVRLPEVNESLYDCPTNPESVRFVNSTKPVAAVTVLVPPRLPPVPALIATVTTVELSATTRLLLMSVISTIG